MKFWLWIPNLGSGPLPWADGARTIPFFISPFFSSTYAMAYFCFLLLETRVRVCCEGCGSASCHLPELWQLLDQHHFCRSSCDRFFWFEIRNLREKLHNRDILSWISDFYIETPKFSDHRKSEVQKPKFDIMWRSYQASPLLIETQKSRLREGSVKIIFVYLTSSSIHTFHTPFLYFTVQDWGLVTWPHIHTHARAHIQYFSLL